MIPDRKYHPDYKEEKKLMRLEHKLNLSFIKEEAKFLDGYNKSEESRIKRIREHEINLLIKYNKEMKKIWRSIEDTEVI